MKAVILAGGLGTRLSEETHLKPKPMVEIGGKPIIWHIMKLYSHHGIRDFVICAGYKAYIIKEYFQNYFVHMSDVTFDISNNEMQVHKKRSEAWTITIVDTGNSTMTGGRLLRVREYLGDETFLFTYGDGVGDVPITKVIDFHRNRGLLATMTAVQPPGRYGALNIDSQGGVTEFMEKPPGDGVWINGGFFVLEPGVMDYIAGDHMPWEHDPLKNLAENRQLTAFRHNGFWRPMDTLRDKHELENLWNKDEAPWKVWKSSV